MKKKQSGGDNKADRYLLMVKDWNVARSFAFGEKDYVLWVLKDTKRHD